MSELIKSDDCHENFHGKLLATASAFVLTVCIASSADASAADEGRPTVWIELGGQMELIQSPADPITAPFMTAHSPTPGPYSENVLLVGQKPSRHAFGVDGKISFQPDNSDWIFTAGIRYGRSHSNRHIHHQTPIPTFHYSFTSSGYLYQFSVPAHSIPFADIKSRSSESHTVLDFSAGKDVGLGMLGGRSSSTINVGIRYAQFTSHSLLDVQGRPSVVPHYTPFFFRGKIPKYFTWDQYSLVGHADRTFHGVGPSLSWNASAEVLGSQDSSELTLDWSVNAAALFGRQKAKTSHTTQQRHEYRNTRDPEYPVIYQTGTGIVRSRSRFVTVPNIGGSIGFSVKYPSAKVSLGYRADFFFGAVDGGIDERHAKTLGFNGPFATISIGFP